MGAQNYQIVRYERYRSLGCLRFSQPDTQRSSWLLDLAISTPIVAMAISALVAIMGLIVRLRGN